MDFEPTQDERKCGIEPIERQWRRLGYAVERLGTELEDEEREAMVYAFWLNTRNMITFFLQEDRTGKGVRAWDYTNDPEWHDLLPWQVGKLTWDEKMASRHIGPLGYNEMPPRIPNSGVDETMIRLLNKLARRFKEVTESRWSFRLPEIEWPAALEDPTKNDPEPDWRALRSAAVPFDAEISEKLRRVFAQHFGRPLTRTTPGSGATIYWLADRRDEPDDEG